jgi:hypothetical protein
MHQKRTTSYQDVTLGAALTDAYYHDGGGTMTVWSTPNYGKSSRAEVLRNTFWDDIAHSNAVYCLPRHSYVANADSIRTDKVDGVNYFHPPVEMSTSVPPVIQAPTITNADSGMSLDHPNAFRTLLSGQSINPFPFEAFRGVPASSDVNASIFVMQMSGSLDKVAIRAIYDIDFVRVSVPVEGVYASVKRYVGANLTDVYDCLYQGSDQFPTDFGPVFACFERSTRLATTETGAAQAMKQAVNRPFYFIWWPDPSQPRLAAPGSTATYAATDPRYYYKTHEDQTEFMFTVPMFPQL